MGGEKEDRESVLGQKPWGRWITHVKHLQELDAMLAWLLGGLEGGKERSKRQDVIEARGHLRNARNASATSGWNDPAECAFYLYLMARRLCWLAGVPAPFHREEGEYYSLAEEEKEGEK